MVSRRTEEMSSFIVMDVLERAIRPFLARVAQAGLDDRLSAREHAYIYVLQDFEGIGDVIDKELAPVSRKLAEKKAAFSQEGLDELRKTIREVRSSRDKEARISRKLGIRKDEFMEMDRLIRGYESDCRRGRLRWGNLVPR